VLKQCGSIITLHSDIFLTLQFLNYDLRARCKTVFPLCCFIHWISA